MISTGFTFDGVHSDTYGISLIRKETGMFPIVYISGKEILEDYPSRASSPFFFRTKKQPYTFSLSFASLDNDLTSAKLKTIASWLFQDTYKPFISDDNPDKILYLMATNQIDFISNGINEGYFDVDFRNQFPYSIQSATPIYDLSANVGTTPITLDCPFNVSTYYYPEIEIALQSPDTSFSLVNTSDSNRTTSFSSLTTGETVYLNNDKKQIISSTGNYRYDNFNKVWFRLAQGTNTINVTGKVIITFRNNYPIFT